MEGSDRGRVNLGGGRERTIQAIQALAAGKRKERKGETNRNGQFRRQCLGRYRGQMYVRRFPCAASRHAPRPVCRPASYSPEPTKTLSTLQSFKASRDIATHVLLPPPLPPSLPLSLVNPTPNSATSPLASGTWDLVWTTEEVGGMEKGKREGG